MPLEDDQRTWLNAALQGKGRIKSASLKKQFENYTRRRAKIAVISDKLPESHSNTIPIRASLIEADKMAKAGRFEDAYKSLDKVKALAKATDKGTSGRIMENEITQRLRTLENLLSVHVAEVDRFYDNLPKALQDMKALEPCSSKGTYEKALLHYRDIMHMQPNLRGAFDDLAQQAAAIQAAYDKRQLPQQIQYLRDELQRLEAAGYPEVAGRHVGRLDAAEGTLKRADRRYGDHQVRMSHYQAALLEAETHLAACKNLDAFPQNQDPSDQQTEDAQKNLKPLASMTIMENLRREEMRMERMRKAYRAERERDRLALAKTGAVDLELTPEQPRFRAGDLLADLHIDPEHHLSRAEIANHATSAGLMVAEKLTSGSTSKSELLDLMTKTLKDLEGDVAGSLYPGIEFKDLSKRQLALVQGLANEMFAKINQNAPNKLSPDTTSVTVGDKVFNKVRVLKSGGLGVATLYEDPLSGKKMVMKTALPNPDPDGRPDLDPNAEMIREMQIMNRLQEGAVKSPQKSAVPEFLGAARGEDGSSHMLMEYIDGGDMEEVSRAMNAIGNSGLLPKAALTAMQGDMVLKAARGLGELQRQGLLHHDIKGLNVMMTKSGDVRIIDYGEASFVSKGGTSDEAQNRNETPGYMGLDGMKKGATVVADNFALGTMLMEMVEQRSVRQWNQNESEGGALGRLISALHKKPDQRVSLEGLSESAFMTATESEVGPEALNELSAAATDFVQETRAVKSPKSYEVLKNGLTGLDGDGGSYFEGFARPGKQLGLDDAQALMRECDKQIEDLLRRLQSPKQEKSKEWLGTTRARLEGLVKAKAYIQTEIIDDMLDTALGKADEAFEKARKDKNLKIDVVVFGKTESLTFDEAVGYHENLVQMLASKRSGVIRWLETAEGEPEEIQHALDEKNEELIELDASIKTVKAQIETAAGPEARLRFVKERLDAATVPFGPSEKRRSQQETVKDEMNRIDAMMGEEQSTSEQKDDEELATN